MMRTDLLGVLRREGDRKALRLERVYATDAADLWSAITEPDRLSRWLGDVSGDLRVGGEFLIVFSADDPTQRTTGEVTECRAPERLAVDWRFEGEAASAVTIDVAADPAGARLVLEHVRLPVSQAAGYGAGWHVFLEQLAADLAGDEGHGSQWDARWEELMPSYRAQIEG